MYWTKMYWRQKRFWRSTQMETIMKLAEGGRKNTSIMCRLWVCVYMYLRNWMNCNFMTFAVCLLNGWIVCVFVWYKVSGFNVTAIWIFTFSIEDFFVKLNVVIIDGIVECNRNHHWHIFWGQSTGNSGSVLRAETIRQNANGRICWNRIGKSCVCNTQ